MLRKFRTPILALTILALAGGFAAARQAVSETKSEVPELSAFHEIVYPIWHTAYPSKDTAALRGFVPQINELAAKIYAAKLPGILRDKTDKWNAGLSQLKAAVEAYGRAASGTDDAALLAAAEALHSKYEALVRAIRPVLPEVDAFHQALYVVYHKAAPEKKFDDIRAAAGDLLTKAEALAKAQLPKRLEAKSEAYRNAAAELLQAAKALDAAGRDHDHDGMLKGVEVLHAKYQALEKIFD